MATITRRLDQFVFPDLCVNCHAPAEEAYPLVTQNGIDFISFRYITLVTLPVPVCAGCRARRSRVGWLAIVGILAGIALALALIAYGPKNAKGRAEDYILFIGVFSIIGLIWYWRNWLRRDLDKAVLGVRGKKFKQATNELTLWFRDTMPEADKLAAARFMADPAAEKASRTAAASSTSTFAAHAEALIRERDSALVEHRSTILADLEAESFRLQVRYRPLILTGALMTMLLAAYLWQSEVQQAQRAGPMGVRSFPLAGMMGFVGLVLAGFGGLTIEVGNGQIVRSFWGLKKILDRRTTIVRKYDMNCYRLEDASGKRLAVSTQLQNHDRLLAECQLRGDAD